MENKFESKLRTNLVSTIYQSTYRTNIIARLDFAHLLELIRMILFHMLVEWFSYSKEDVADFAENLFGAVWENKFVYSLLWVSNQKSPYKCDVECWTSMCFSKPSLVLHINPQNRHGGEVFSVLWSPMCLLSLQFERKRLGNFK
jgi:hypothetical protein